ncbi:MAG TPA: hypothetical protein PKE39_01295 [Ignavibacteria bacterium]|nr:hypothetical protein [Ignavibacteria bacterium]HMQ97632.1 hypothetical protein [Ignavibacteria bacterium]
MNNSFNKILDNLVEGEKYKTLPPRGPIDLPFPSVSDEELQASEEDIYGQNERDPLNKENPNIKIAEQSGIYEVKLPDSKLLEGLSVIGIAGNNIRILTTSFHLILSKAAVVNFKYTKGFDKPYFYTKFRNSSALMVLDNNIFEDNYSLFTYNDLSERDISVPILDHIYKNPDKPFRFKYNYEKSKKSPSSQSLGLAVKFQHTLELSTIEDTNFDQLGTTICLKEGALFSNSTQQTDIKNGLKKLFQWADKPKIFIAVSSKVFESRVFINTLTSLPHLIEDYFPDQNITTKIINSFGTDTLLLKKILKPGFRTPLIEYIEKTREGVISDPELEGLKPVTCYYHKRTKPYNFIRLEIPKFMWEKNKALVEFAISVVIWQYELGGSKPLVLKAALERCELDHEKNIIEQQMKAAFEKKKLDLIEFLSVS